MPEALVPPADWLLEVNNLSCGYGGDSVVKDVSFALSHGDIGCLLGPSGCGKSTLLRMIAGLEEATGGTTSIPGQDRRPAKHFTCFSFLNE